jgi:hypothetical protein
MSLSRLWNKSENILEILTSLPLLLLPFGPQSLPLAESTVLTVFTDKMCEHHPNPIQME